MTAVEHRRIGLEQEFFLVNEEGVLSNRADEFLHECRRAAHASGRDSGSFAPEPEKRQVGVVDSWGGSAAHTGAETDSWRGHVTGDGYAVTGNLVAEEEVVMAMAATFEASKVEPLPERLVRALEAGQAAGGDKRGKQSAAVTTVKDQPYPYIDLRVDEHPDPVVELRRIYEVVKAQMLPFIEALPTRRNPKGDFGEEIRGALIPE